MDHILCLKFSRSTFSWGHLKNGSFSSFHSDLKVESWGSSLKISLETKQITPAYIFLFNRVNLHSVMVIFFLSVHDICISIVFVHFFHIRWLLVSCLSLPCHKFDKLRRVEIFGWKTATIVFFCFALNKERKMIYSYIEGFATNKGR